MYEYSGSKIKTSFINIHPRCIRINFFSSNYPFLKNTTAGDRTKLVLLYVIVESSSNLGHEF